MDSLFCSLEFAMEKRYVLIVIGSIWRSEIEIHVDAKRNLQTTFSILDQSVMMMLRLWGLLFIDSMMSNGEVLLICNLTAG